MASEICLLSKDQFEHLLKKVQELDRRNEQYKDRTNEESKDKTNDQSKDGRNEPYNKPLPSSDRNELYQDKEITTQYATVDPTSNDDDNDYEIHQTQIVKTVWLLNEMELMLCLILGIMSIYLSMSMA